MPELDLAPLSQSIQEKLFMELMMQHILMQEAAGKSRMIRTALNGFRSGTLQQADGDGSVQMTETRIYIGLNDAETRKQEYGTGMYLDTLKEICRKYRAAFSVCAVCTFAELRH